MDLYLYKGRIDLAATTLADLQLLVAALADESDPTNAATIARVIGKIPPLVQSDTAEPLTLYSYDDAGVTLSSWLTAVGTTVTVSVGEPSAATTGACTTTTAAISGSSRVASLALNTSRLADALFGLRPGRGRQLYLHVRSSPVGGGETMLLLPVDVQAGVINTTTNEADAIQANAAAASAAAALASEQAAAASEVATGADAIATAADRVQTGLDRVATAADKIACDADAVATAADRVQTGLDVVSADASEAAASAAQTAAEAAQAAAEAAEAGASAIAAANVYQLTLPRAIKDALYSDGATSNRRAEWAPGTAGAVAGMAISIPFEFKVPTSNPSASAFAFAFAPAGTSAPTAQAYALAGYINTSGGLVIEQEGATGGTDYRRFAYAGFRAAYTGLWVRGFVVFTVGDSTTAPVVYLQGADASASFTGTTAGTAPNWMPTTLDTTKFLSGYAWSSGRFIPHSPILGVLSATEVLEWTQTGRLPSWCDVGTGTNVTKYSSDFSAGADGWAVNGATGLTVSGNVDGIGGQDNVLSIVNSTGSSKAISIQKSLVSGISNGMRIRVTALARAETGAFISTAYLQNGSSGGGVSDAGNGQALTADTWVSVETLATYARGDGFLVLNVSSASTGGTVLFLQNGKTLWLKDIKYWVIGPIFKPVIQPIAVVADTGTNKIAGVSATGITPITEKRDWLIQASTNTNGNQQLLGASVFFDYTKHVLDDWCMQTAGTPTVTAGSASAGTQYKASGALTAARNMITLVTRVLASAALWCGSNDTSTVQHTIRGHIVD